MEPVNESVRRRLRSLRLSRKLRLTELARRIGIPTSSYACMEAGHYKISLDHLGRILGALDADINDVWPVEAAREAQISRLQEFRLAEIISLGQAEGAALFRVSGSKCRVLLHCRLSDFLLDRLCLYLEDGRVLSQGIWFRRRRGEAGYLFFLKAENCPAYLAKLIENYLSIWVALYD